MRVLTVVRTAPVRLSARLHSSDQEAGMTTAEYAVGTVVHLWHHSLHAHSRRHLLQVVTGPYGRMRRR